MTIFIVKDDNPEGGYFSFGPEFPNLEAHPGTVVEVRSVEGHDDLWDRWMVGKLPVAADGTLDELLVGLWPEGSTEWRAGDG